MDVIFRPRASTVCIHDSKLLVLQARDPVSGEEYLLIPGGAIEAGETAAAAAVRETFEETGHQVIVDPASELVRRYDFVWGEKLYDCLTWFYRASLAGDGQPQGPGLDSPVLLSCQWLDLAQVPQAMSYHPVIQEAVLKLLAGLGECPR